MKSLLNTITALGLLIVGACSQNTEEKSQTTTYRMDTADSSIKNESANSDSITANDSNTPQKQKFIFTTIEKNILADGFDFPVGNPDGKGKYTSLIDHKEYESWYVSVKTGDKFDFGIHTGEDWNGSGGGNTDFGQPVFSIGKGIVLSAGNYVAPLGMVILIEHIFIENDSIKKIFSCYAHLNEIFVKKGDVIERRQKIGTIGTGGGNIFKAHLHLEIRKQSMAKYPVLFFPSLEGKNLTWVFENYEIPTKFINERRILQQYGSTMKNTD